MAKPYTLFALLLALSLSSCSSGQQAPQPSIDEDLAAIAEARTNLLEALRSDDVPGIIAVLTDDHLTMAPDGPTPPDNRALAEWHQARVDLYQFKSTFNSNDIQVHGDIAIERWSSDIQLIPRDGGETVEDSSKGVWIWERQQDGTWKLLWSIWNSDLPA